MARRNGRGSKSLAETISQFERAQVRLLDAVENANILSSREAGRLAQRFEKSSAQKRSSDVLAAAIHMNKLICSSLREHAGEAPKSAGGELDVLGEMTMVLRNAIEPRDNLEQVLKLAGELFTYNQATVFLYDRAREVLRPAASVGGVVDLISGVEFDKGSGFSAWVAGRKDPILLADLQRPAAAGELPLRCFMSAPILVDGELMGVVSFGAGEPRAYDEDHVRLLTIVAGILAATLTRVEAERLLGELAAHDPLSGVMTHRLLDERIAEEIDRSRRFGDALTLALFEISGFQVLVDQFGIKYGNQVVSDFGNILRHNARQCDQLGRVGADQIAVLFVHTSAGDARVAAQRLADAVGAHSFPRRKRLSARFSLTAFPEGGEDLPTLLATARRRLAADQSLREVRQQRRFDPVLCGFE